MRLLGTVPSASVKSAAVHFYPHDVLYGRLRPYLNKVLTADFEGLASAEFIPLTAPEGIVPKFLQYRLNAADFVSFASHLDEGDRPRVDFNQIGEFPLQVPSTNQQKRIVAAIESYFTRLDDAVATLERVQRNLERYRSSVLKAAVEGRLVPTEAELARSEGRDYEPASVLLERILAERRRRWEEAELARMKAAGTAPRDDRWRTKYEEPAGPQLDGLPRLPAGWTWATIDQLAHLVRNGYGKKPYAEGPVRILRISAVRPMRVDFSDCRWLPGDPADYTTDLLQPGDLLFTRYNGSPALVGVSGLARAVDRPTVHPDKLIKVRLVAGGALEAYVEIATNTGTSRRFIERRTRTTAGQAGISGGDIRQVPVPLPPRSEQQRIAAEVERLLTLADDARGALRASVMRSGRLRQTVLKWAFEDKLVDHDTVDEPSSKLLERLRTERQTTADEPPKRTERRKAKATA